MAEGSPGEWPVLTGEIGIAHFTKRYRTLRALADVSFAIWPGEVLGVIGPNGSGKTTLFECLGGTLPADAGEVRGHGRSLTRRERAALFFYVPDAIAPWPAQSVAWALDFTVGFFGGRARLREDVERRLSLEPFLDSRIGALSKGQRKRVLLAIGLLAPQPVLLVDEPFDGLDLRQSRDVVSMLRACAADGRTIVLSIHQIHDAARVCDRFLLLSEGRARGEGTLGDLSRQAAARGVAPAAANLEELFLALT